MNKRFLLGNILLFLTALLIGIDGARGQTPKQLYDARVFKGNTYSYPVIDLPLDDTANYTARLYYSKLGAALPNALQPVVEKSIGFLRVKLNTTNVLPALAWLEIKSGSQTRYMANVYTDKSGRVQLGASPDEASYISLLNELTLYLTHDSYDELLALLLEYNF
jgi:hypothetical protein